MKTTISNITCPKCNHNFTYDSGWSEFVPFETIQEAEKAIEENKTLFPNMKWDIVNYKDGWMLDGHEP